MDKLQVLRSIDPLLSLFGTIGTLASLIYALKIASKSKTDSIQLQVSAQKQLDMLKRQQQESENILSCLSTRGLGTMANYLPEVAKLIKTSRGKLRIIASLPTHGSFTQRKLWGEVQTALSERLNKADESNFQAILIYSHWKYREEALRTQYAALKKESDWKEWRDRADNHKLISDLLRHNYKHYPKPQVSELSLQDFIKERVVFDDLEMHTAYPDPFWICEGREIYPIFCWITDEEAVFSLRSEDQSGNYTGSGMYTKDPNLRLALEKTFEFYLARYREGKNALSADPSLTLGE